MFLTKSQDKFKITPNKDNLVRMVSKVNDKGAKAIVGTITVAVIIAIVTIVHKEIVRKETVHKEIVRSANKENAQQGTIVHHETEGHKANARKDITISKVANVLRTMVSKEATVLSKRTNLPPTTKNSLNILS